MSISVLNSAIFKDMFGTSAMREVFDDASTIQRYVEIEIALAVVQARLGVIPEKAATEIKAGARASNIDIERLRADTEIVGYPILPLVHQLAQMCGSAGEYLHWGATTQDIMDTATVLQVRDALVLIEADLAECDRVLESLAERYRGTLMVGRTLLQQALPITFGYKAAVWLSMIRRHRVRLAQLRPRLLVGQFGGAVGTLASLGKDGLAVHEALMAELKLGAAPITWHVARDGFAEVVQFLALVASSLGKLAMDIMLMMSNEFGEVSEPFVSGRGASSTMPQKRNPVSCTLIWNASKVVRQDAGLALDAMMQEFERATGPWHLEWSAIPEAFILTAGSLRQANFMLAGLEVNEDSMRGNLDLSRGLIMAEAVMMGLAPHIGRQTSHDVVYLACRKARENGCTLADALYGDPQIASKLDKAMIDGLCDPKHYLGSATEMIDRVRAMPSE